MSLNIVCYYADFGRPYAPLIERMTKSAKELMPDARTVLLTPTKNTMVQQYFDTIYAIDCQTEIGTLCRERARAMATWMTYMEGGWTVFVDPDVYFRRAIEFGEHFDVGLLWRSKPDQPINTGLILARHGCPDFWQRYGKIAVNLPKAIHHWWCDQIAFALMTSVMHKAGDILDIEDARVWLMDANRHCALPGREVDETWAIHEKGRLKGEGWDKIFTGRDPEKVAAE